MTRPDFMALGPLIILTLTAAIIMLQIAVRRHHGDPPVVRSEMICALAFAC